MFMGGGHLWVGLYKISQGFVVPIPVGSAVGTIATYGLSLPIRWIIPWLYSILCLFPCKILHVDYIPWSFRGWWEFPFHRSWIYSQISSVTRILLTYALCLHRCRGFICLGGLLLFIYLFIMYFRKVSHLSRHGGNGLVVGLHDLRGLFQP